MAKVPMNDQFYIGRGVDPDTGKTFKVAIEFDPPQPAAAGQDVTLMLQSITSSQELAESLSISMSASISKGVWGGSAGFNMMRSRTVNKYYTYALVNVEVKHPALTLRNPRLTQEAEKKLKNEGWSAFVSLYGEEYIEGIISGGSYYAMIEIQTKDESEQQSVKAKLSGHYGTITSSVSVQKTFSDIKREMAVNVFLCQSGGSGDVLEITLEDMMKQAVNFPALVNTKPSSVFALTAEYRNTVSLPSVPDPDALSYRRKQRDILNELGARYLKLRDYKSSVQFVLDNFSKLDEFPSWSFEKAEEKRAGFSKSLEDTAKDIDMIVKKATSCADDATKCEEYVPTATILPLPTIGDNLMSLKNLEERVGRLESTSGSLSAILNGKSTVDGGFIKKNYSAIQHPIATGEGKRTDIIHIDFSPGRFSKTPSVVTMLDSFEMVGNPTVNVFPINITPAGFDCAIEVWWNTHLHAVTTTWVAYTN